MYNTTKICLKALKKAFFFPKVIENQIHEQFKSVDSKI